MILENRALCVLLNRQTRMEIRTLLPVKKITNSQEVLMRSEKPVL